MAIWSVYDPQERRHTAGYTEENSEELDGKQFVTSVCVCVSRYSCTILVLSCLFDFVNPVLQWRVLPRSDPKARKSALLKSVPGRHHNHFRGASAGRSDTNHKLI